MAIRNYVTTSLTSEDDVVEFYVHDVITVDAGAGDDWILTGRNADWIIGGLGNLQGTAAAAVLLSLMEGVITAFADPVVARITSLCVMSAVLLVRPQGIFAGATA